MATAMENWRQRSATEAVQRKMTQAMNANTHVDAQEHVVVHVQAARTVAAVKALVIEACIE